MCLTTSRGSNVAIENVPASKKAFCHADSSWPPVSAFELAAVHLMSPKAATYLVAMCYSSVAEEVLQQR